MPFPIGCIGDTHFPFEHRHYLDFCQQTFKRFKCKTIVHQGDVTDNHSLGEWDHDPDGFSGGTEAKQARKSIKKWSKAFPKLLIAIGNHDNRIFRKAMKHGISRSWIKSYNEFWESPKTWQWQPSFDIKGVLITHGTKSGKYAALQTAIGKRQSVVIGHTHTFGGVQYSASHKDIIFGGNAGCGIDIKRYAFAYGKEFDNRPTLGCLIVHSPREAQFVPMEL